MIELPHKSRFYVKTEPYRDPSWKENTWSYTKVEIFDRDQGDIKIGEYLRNYSRHGENTFHPFKTKSGKWYALYSEKYHATYVMSLPDCKKIAQCTSARLENKFDTSGFCPVQYYIPFVSAWNIQWGDKFPDKPKEEVLWDIIDETDLDEPYDTIDWHHLDVGFVYGCYWGAEYYIQLMDLTKIEEGIVNFSCPFDPAEVPEKIKNFSDVISVQCNDKGKPYGVSVNAKFYRFKLDSFEIMTSEEENELYKKWSEERKKINENEVQ